MVNSLKYLNLLNLKPSQWENNSEKLEKKHLDERNCF